MARGKPLLIELEVFHPCMNIEALEKMKEEEALTVMRGITKSTREEISHMFTFKSDDPKRLIALHKKMPGVKKVEVISLSPKSADVVLTSEPDVGVAHALAKSRCIAVEPVVTEGGVDHVVIFAPSFKAFKEFLGILPEDYEVKLKRKRYLGGDVKIGLASFQAVGFLELKAAAELLTEKQREIFNLAVAKGYYAKPRRVTLQELADMTGIKAATLHEHLSKAEAKLLPILSKLMRGV